MFQKNLKKILISFFLFGLFIGLGPRTPVNTDLITPEITNKLNDLDSYLKQKESRFNNITPKTEKKIIWANPENKQKTEYSIIHLHGYSATRQETSPLSENVAQLLGANLYLGRLKGHGRNGKAMLEGNVNTWLTDGLEALEIGKRIGKKVVFIGCSTGASIGHWLALNRPSQSWAGFIYLSPNFGPKRKSSKVFNYPWGLQLAHLIAGKTYSWKPANEFQEKYWSHSYPTESLAHMMALIKLVKDQDSSKMTQPIMVLYNHDDQVVEASNIVEAFEKIGSKTKKLIEFDKTNHKNKHILVGYIFGKGNQTAILSQKIAKFIRESSTNQKP